MYAKVGSDISISTTFSLSILTSFILLILTPYQKPTITTKPTNPNPPKETMHPITLLVSLLPLSLATTLSYDPGYSDRTRSLNVVSCSDGANGLITRYGWTTQGQIPRFPYIGGSSDVAGWNSPSCGQCYQVEYARTGKKVFVLAVDHAAQGLNVAREAMDDLTNGQAVSF